MVQNRKVPSWMLLASFAVLSIISSFIITTTTLADASQPIALIINRPSDSAILSVRIHNQTKNTQKCFSLVQQDSITSNTTNTSNTSTTSNTLQFNAGSPYSLTDRLHIQIFSTAQCKGPVQKNITNPLSKLLGTSQTTSLQNQTRSSKQAPDGLDLEPKDQTI